MLEIALLLVNVNSCDDLAGFILVILICLIKNPEKRNAMLNNF